MTFLAVALFTTRVVQVDAHENVIVEKKECQVKYVYLYSFGLLTTWPKASFANDKASFVIGVFGEKPYSELLDRLARTKKIRGQRIVIHRFRKSDDYKKCHILYITRSVKKEERVRLLKQLHHSPVRAIVKSCVPGTKSGGVFLHDSIGECLVLHDVDHQLIASEFPPFL